MANLGRTSTRLPAVFVSHGSPTIAIEDDPWGPALTRYASKLPKPRAVVVVSGHWEAPGAVRVTASPTPETIHDFGGFPEELYRIRYPARGDPGLAALVMRLLNESGFPAKTDPERGLDHGAWVPLMRLYPKADVPIVEISQPLRRNPEDMLRMGGALSRLRDEGVLLLGTGGVVHNLRLMDPADDPNRVEDWAREFDEWIQKRLEAMDVAAIASYQTAAPHSRLAVPTPDHFDPIFVVLGSALPGERVITIYEGFRYGTISMRSFALG
ncbi:MAG: class III extradiol ring-cleavage dioxygenase [Thermoanaerobaculia bacterium]